MTNKIEISRELAQNWLSYMLASDSPQLKIWASLLGSAIAAPAVERQEPVSMYKKLHEIATEAAISSTVRYSYMPHGSYEGWQPHSWVISAMQKAIDFYTSTPAPVAVVLPERMADYDVEKHPAYLHGWNACLDKVKEMNGGKAS